jgi:hypothetical protein
VRLGDLAAAFVVFAGTAWVALDASGFAIVNLVLVAVWLALALALALAPVRWNLRLTAGSAAG